MSRKYSTEKGLLPKHARNIPTHTRIKNEVSDIPKNVERGIRKTIIHSPNTFRNRNIHNDWSSGIDFKNNDNLEI